MVQNYKQLYNVSCPGHRRNKRQSKLINLIVSRNDSTLVLGAALQRKHFMNAHTNAKKHTEVRGSQIDNVWHGRKTDETEV